MKGELKAELKSNTIKSSRPAMNLMKGELKVPQERLAKLPHVVAWNLMKGELKVGLSREHNEHGHMVLGIS